jgi:hypothetical protein
MKARILNMSLAACLHLPAAAALQEEINWPEFIGRHDLVWEETPRQWNEGGFTGNGQLGMMVYATLADNRLDFHLGRADVTDHRGALDRKTSFGMPGKNVMFDYPRLDLGRMALRPSGKIKSVTMRQELWNAELHGTIETDLGKLQFRALTPRDEMVQVIDVSSTEKNPDGTPAPWRWEFLPGNPDSPRYQAYPDKAPDYEHNPRPEFKTLDGIPVLEQPLLAGGDYATAWKEVSLGQEASRLFVTTANEIPSAGSSAPVAVETVRRASTMNMGELLSAHREWWHGFYQKSFLSIPDPRLESFYWIQLHKFAAAARESGPVVDLHGPWFRVNQWPGVWWNLNVQQTYWLPVLANHPDLASTLIDEMDRYWEPLINTLGSGAHRGDVAWVLHNYWLHYRHAGDWNALAEKWQPMALQMLEKYRGAMELEADGRLHLKPMGSPEFKGFQPFKDTNYNLALIRWLAASLKTLSDRTGAGAAEARDWSEIAAKLIDPPVDANGLMIGSTQSFDESHRHFSHIIGFYPLFVLDADDPATHRLLTQSIQHWLTIRNPDGKQDHCGFTLAVAASKKAALGKGDEALGFLDDLLNNRILKQKTYGASQLLSNTFNVESRGKNPTIETPFAGASATIELLLQSWGNKVRVFPAVPTGWKQASFRDLRAQGAFLVSAAREEGKTAWVSIESLAGEPLVLKVPDWTSPLEIVSGPKQELLETTPGEYTIALKKGERITLRPAGSQAEVVVRPLARPAEKNHPYGVKKGGSLPHDMSWPVQPLRIEQ